MSAPNADGADRANDQPRQDQTTNTETVADLDADRNAFATMAAKLCLAGYSLHEMAHGGYIVTRWNLVFHTNDLAGVRGFCVRAGVRT